MLLRRAATLLPILACLEVHVRSFDVTSRSVVYMPTFSRNVLPPCSGLKRSRQGSYDIGKGRLGGVSSGKA